MENPLKSIQCKTSVIFHIFKQKVVWWLVKSLTTAVNPSKEQKSKAFLKLSFFGLCDVITLAKQ